MSTSRNTIAGRSRRATSIAWRPSAASWRSKSVTSSSVVVISLRMNLSSSTISTPRLIREPHGALGRSSELAADALEYLVVDRLERFDHTWIEMRARFGDDHL